MYGMTSFGGYSGISLGGGASGLMFSLIPVLFLITFVIILAIFGVTAVRALSRWNHNNQSPILSVEASVTGKRSETRVHHHRQNSGAGMNHNTSHTSYYATFEVASGDRMELELPTEEYALLAEGDRGMLTFQGTRFQGFVRAR